VAGPAVRLLEDREKGGLEIVAPPQNAARQSQQNHPVKHEKLSIGPGGFLPLRILVE
jgi:hypothetical protein